MVYYLFLFIVFILLLLYLSTILSFFITRVPFIRSPEKIKNKILEVAGIKENDVLYDLGCGIGDLLVLVERKYRVKAYGFELSPIPFLIAKLNIYFHKSSAQVFCKDFFKADLSKADIVFCYLMPEINKKLSSKLTKELKKGAKVLSYAFSFLDWIVDKKIVLKNNDRKSTPIFLYLR